jgi:tRNA-dihydrouridine synthase B
MKTLTINNIKLKNPLLLAPMVDVTNLPYRLICRQAGCSLAYTEMLYIDAILHNNSKTLNLMKTSKEDKPIGIQITGNSPEEFKKFIPYAKPFNLIDINCGCPSMRITGNQAGSYLLQNPEKIAKMIKILKSANLTVTAKIRLGFKKNNVLKIAKAIEKAGADALTLHPRLATQSASTPADHKYTKLLSRSLTIPIIANGDIFNEEKAAELLDFADGIMLARSAIGDPLIFKRILHYIKTGKKIETTQNQNIQILKKYLLLSNKISNPIDLQRIKYVTSNFLKGTHGSANQRKKIMSLSSLEAIQKFINSLPYRK